MTAQIIPALEVRQLQLGDVSRIGDAGIKLGMIGVSGASLIFFDGTDWKAVNVT